MKRLILSLITGSALILAGVSSTLACHKHHYKYPNIHSYEYYHGDKEWQDNHTNYGG